jgi:TM2 domain-containing membrane protein YozV
MDTNYNMLPNLEFKERLYLQSFSKDMNEEEQKEFFVIYASMRKDPQDVLIFTLLGFIGIAGIQRIILNRILLGILYFVTCGFCGIGTIIDLINYKELTYQFNTKIANQSLALMKK